MNIKQLIVAASILITAGSVFAQSSSPPETSSDNAVHSGKTRAQVRAELVQARAEGLVDFNDLNYPLTPSTKSSKTRAQDKTAPIPEK
jgi:hypothetical protein